MELKDLDEILEWMANNQTPRDVDDIKKGFNSVHNDDKTRDFELAIRKFDRDGLVDVEDTSKSFRNRKFRINYDGILFLNNDGYIGQAKDVKVKRYRQNLLNTIVALGTFFAGLYGVVEIAKCLLRFFYC